MNPPEDEVTAPWWAATRERRLLLQTCATCERVQHPPRALCTACGGLELGWSEAGGMGTVDACTVVMRAAQPDATAPYVVARVRLVEGPIILTNVVGLSPSAVAIGQQVRLDWRPLADGRALPVFRPDRSRPFRAGPFRAGPFRAEEA